MNIWEIFQVQPQEPVFHFKAQPIPANILKGPVGIPPKKIASPTVPSTPQIRVPLRYKVGVKTPVYILLQFLLLIIS